MPISEAELILPALHIINNTINGAITITELSAELRNILKPSGEDLEPLKNRNDDKFSQKVRNLVSHKTLEKLGYVISENGKLKITAEGISYISEDFNKIDIEEKYPIEFEGSETIDFENINFETNTEDTENATDNSTDKIYPQAVLSIQGQQFSVYELKRKHEKNKLLLDPEFQRKEVWKSSQKAELVESLLMNIPLPFIYLTESKKGDLIVIDGRQRLTALFEFIDNKFSLGNKLRILTSLKNKKFKDLDPVLQGSIEDYQLVTHIIKSPTQPRIMIDIFDRVNRSGTQLNNQEIRNALYQGKSTKLLKILSESEVFKKVTDNSVKPERMRDRYIVLRALSFYLWKTLYNENNTNEYIVDYKGDTEEFLPKYMQYINSLEDSEVASIGNMFSKSLIDIYNILGGDAFRLPAKKTIKRPISMALFEVLVYWFSNEDYNTIRDKVKIEYDKLMIDEEFEKSFLSIDTNTKYRFNRIDQIKKSLV